MLIALYPSKKALKASIGKTLNRRETSMFGPEYRDNGSFSVCNRPSLVNYAEKNVREFFARVTMKDGKIAKVD
jgi:hypothetical protein